MKTTLLRLLCLALAAMPVCGAAQTNIRSAFDAIINSSAASVTASHSLDRNPATGTKTGQSDVYNFTIPAKKMDLVKRAVEAFDKDADQAYGMNSGTSRSGSTPIRVAVGDDNGAGVLVNPTGFHYVYATFLAPKTEDPDGIYRYAYALCYKEADGMVTGKLVVTYATTLMHRQQKSGRLRVLTATLGDDEGGKQTWFGRMMQYVNTLDYTRSSSARAVLAVKIYELAKEMPEHKDVTDTDKSTVREVLAGIEKDRRNDKKVRTLLNQTIDLLKK